MLMPRFFLRGLVLLLAVGLSPGVARAQSYLGWVDNDYPGATYNEGDAEVGGFLYLDNSLRVGANLTVDGNLSISNELDVSSLHVAAGNIDGSLTDFTVDGGLESWAGLEVWSNFSPGMPESWGAGASWIHASLDLGDLTYTDTDTPAFNISEEEFWGALYPTIYFTGYDANTTWTWQQNGLAAMNADDATLLEKQMALSADGNLTLSDPAGNDTLQVEPEGGNLNLSATAAQLRAVAASGDNVTMVTGNDAVVFYDSTGNTTQSLTPASVASAYASGAQSLGFGANATVPAQGAFAFGNDLSTAYYGAIVMGAGNAGPDHPTRDELATWQSADPLLVVGAGGANALTVYKNGATEFDDQLTIQGHVTLNGTATTFTRNVTLNANGTAGNATSVSTARGGVPQLGD